MGFPETPMPRWAKALVFLALAAAAVWALAPVGDVVVLVVLGTLLAYLLDPLAVRLEARGMSRTAASAALFVGLIVAIGVPVGFMMPALAGQVAALQEGIDLEATSELLVQIERWLGDRLRPLGVARPDLREQVAVFLSEHLYDVVGFVPSVLALATQVVLVPVIAFFMLKDGRHFRRGFISLVPNRYFEFTLNALRKADLQLGGYLRGQFLAALIVGLLATFALWLIGVDYYLVVGLVAGLANLIPFLGPLIGGAVAIAVSVATTGSFEQVALIVVAFAMIQVIDNFGTQPLVLSRNVELHPLVILLVLLTAGEVFGLLGLLLAVPAAAVTKVLVQEFVTTFRSYRFS
jgi:putative permease